MWWWRERIGDVEFGFTDRFGGESVGAYSQLNVSLNTGDDRAVVERNRAVLGDQFAVRGFATTQQIHGSDISYVDDIANPVGDGLVTSTSELALMVMSADCVPLLVASEERIGAFHIGRQGLMAGLTEKACAQFDGHESVFAAIGPYACGQCYELPTDMAAEISTRYRFARSTTHRGTTGIDVGLAIRQLLESSGITVLDTPEDCCTIENERFFSHRSGGRNLGRQAAVVMIHDA